MKVPYFRATVATMIAVAGIAAAHASGNTYSVGAANNVCLAYGSTITVDGLSPGAFLGVNTEDAPTATTPVTFATGVAEGEEAYFASDNLGSRVEHHVQRGRGDDLRAGFGWQVCEGGDRPLSAGGRGVMGTMGTLGTLGTVGTMGTAGRQSRHRPRCPQKGGAC